MNGTGIARYGGYTIEVNESNWQGRGYLARWYNDEQGDYGAALQYFDTAAAAWQHARNEIDGRAEEEIQKQEGNHAPQP
jgi:hypothetical protein